MKTYSYMKWKCVATALWRKCEVATHTPENGNLESSGTPENSEDDCRGQNTSHWGVFYIVEKVLKCRCPKWPRMSHLDICSPSYGQKKGRESTRSWRALGECDTALESSRRELQHWFRPRPDRRLGRETMTVQSPGSPNRDNFGTPLWESWDKKPFGCSLHGVTQSIIYGGRWWLPPSPGRGESSESKVTRGLSQHQKDAEWVLTTLWLVLDVGPNN
jgi:hypothetical protein